MNIHTQQFDFKNLEHLITRVRKLRNLTDIENGLLNVATNIVARAVYGADHETLRCLMAMSERIDTILHRNSTEVIDLTSHFAGQIWHVERKPQRGIWQEAA